MVGIRRSCFWTPGAGYDHPSAYKSLEISNHDEDSRYFSPIGQDTSIVMGKSAGGASNNSGEQSYNAAAQAEQELKSTV